MCAEYESRTSKRKVEEALNRRLSVKDGQSTWDLHVKLTSKAPIVEISDGELSLTTRVFPAHPFPNARLSGVDDANSDGIADFRRLYDRATWKQGFQQERCLAVATTFLEPAYWGPNAGSVVRFQMPKEELFFIAAIGIKPNKPATGKRNGFALLTHTMTKQMELHHHRYVVILKPESAIQYLDFPKQTRSSEIFDFLLDHRYTGPLDESIARKMAKGWEKRVDLHEAKFANERKYINSLKAEGIRG